MIHPGALEAFCDRIATRLADTIRELDALERAIAGHHPTAAGWFDAHRNHLRIVELATDMLANELPPKTKLTRTRRGNQYHKAPRLGDATSILEALHRISARLAAVMTDLAELDERTTELPYLTAYLAANAAYVGLVKRHIDQAITLLNDEESTPAAPAAPQHHQTQLNTGATP